MENMSKTVQLIKYKLTVSVYARLRLGPGVGEEELSLISRMLRDTPVHFVWIMGDTVDWKSLTKSTIVSRFPRVYFTTKVSNDYRSLGGGGTGVRFPPNMCY